jgi:hypothetical protein
MRVVKMFVMMLCLGVLALSVPLGARADEWNKETIMTFNKPVEVPGMVLKPGTYDFRLLDSAADRNVVQIFNADGSHLYENVLAIPAYRLEPSDKTIVTFEERTQGEPDAIATWFYPGDNIGEEFVYPKAESAALTVKANAAIWQPSVAPPARSEPAPASVPQQANPASSPAFRAAAPTNPVFTKEPVQVAQATTQPKPQAASTVTVPQQKETLKKLPKTASPIPLVIVLGLLSLAGSAGLQMFSKRSA